MLGIDPEVWKTVVVWGPGYALALVFFLILAQMYKDSREEKRVLMNAVEKMAAVLHQNNIVIQRGDERQQDHHRQMRDMVEQIEENRKEDTIETRRVIGELRATLEHIRTQRRG